MRIQDMRSGILHRSKRIASEQPEDASGAPVLADRYDGPPSELQESCWSVVSFDKQEAGGLTYRQATQLAALLDAHGTNGLCIVTDHAAKRYGT